MTEQHWIIWDGDCGFCRRSITWFKHLDSNNLFRAVPFQQCPSPPMTAELLALSRNALQVITQDGRQVSGGRAVIFILKVTGWHPKVVHLAQRRPFLWAVDFGYQVVAQHRHFFSRFLFCRR